MSTGELFVCARAGRIYLAKNGELVAALIACLKMETKDVLTHDHALGCLQRLSLKSVSHSQSLATQCCRFHFTSSTRIRALAECTLAECTHVSFLAPSDKNNSVLFLRFQDWL